MTLSNKLQRGSQATAFLAAFVAVGVPYWLIPYRQVSLPNALLTAGLVAVPLTALLLRSFGAACVWLATAIAASAVPAVVIARVVVDCLQDPTAHNLWPFEVIIAIVLGFGPALVGALTGKLIVVLSSAARRDAHIG
jgi:pyridoxal biosynthesis lyase PdxS